MKTLLWGLLLLPMVASAQLYDFSDTLTGTETIFNYATSGPPSESVTDVTMPVTGFVDVTNTGPATFGFITSAFDINGPTGGYGGATGPGAVSWQLGDDPGIGESVDITPTSATFTSASGCESEECMVYNLAGGPGTWVDTSASSAPEISTGGAAAALTLLAGLLAIANTRRSQRSTDKVAR